MQKTKIKNYTDGIWISWPRENTIVNKLTQLIQEQGFEPTHQHPKLNYGCPFGYKKSLSKLYCRLVDSVFHNTPEAWDTNSNDIIITDSVQLRPTQAKTMSVLPEFWHIWHFEPQYQDQPSTIGYNCFMNRPRGDRSTVFYELLKRNILEQGLVSYNCTLDDLDQNFVNTDQTQYQQQHKFARGLIPYNTVEDHGTLEQCIIDTNISLVLETYISDCHIVFSEKIFRCLQMPRPWLLYCSPGSVQLLKSHGFDVLDDIVDIAYDQIVDHQSRLQIVLDQLETFISRKYSQQDYQRFHAAANHNQQMLLQYSVEWKHKFQLLAQEIKQL